MIIRKDKTCHFRPLGHYPWIFIGISNISKGDCGLAPQLVLARALAPRRFGGVSSKRVKRISEQPIPEEGDERLPIPEEGDERGPEIAFRRMPTPEEGGELPGSRAVYRYGNPSGQEPKAVGETRP